jgi:hypothetical protein
MCCPNVQLAASANIVKNLLLYRSREQWMVGSD